MVMKFSQFTIKIRIYSKIVIFEKKNDFYRRFYDIFDTYVESICFVFIPFILMSFCSLLIILQIFETRKTIRYNTQGKFYYYTFSASETIPTNS